jgi:hypothetical protein
MNLFRCVLVAVTLVAFPAIAVNAASASTPSSVTEPAVGPTLSGLRVKAEQGHPGAQHELGLAYFRGRQTAQDPVEAFVWLTLAAEKGVSGEALGRISAGLSASQRGQASRRLEFLRSAYPNLRPPPSFWTIKDGEAAVSSPLLSAPSSTIPNSSRDSSPTIDVKRLQEQLTAAETRLRESQKQLSKQSTELANLRADSAIDRLELDLRKEQLAAAKQALAAGAVDDSSTTVPSSILERERAAHAATKAALAAAERQLAELATARAALERELASRNGIGREKGVQSVEARPQPARATEISRKAAVESAQKDPGSAPQALAPPL